MLADAGGTAAEFQLAVLTLHLVILPLLSQNNMFPVRAFKRRHFKSSGGFGDNVWWLGGGWCKPRVPPKIAKIRCRINSVLYRMGRLKSPYDPFLLLMNL